MKTEITPENKAKFFALYWGQKIAHYSDGNNARYTVCVGKYHFSSIHHIILKPLSSISDEDSSVIRGIIWEYPGYTSITNTHYIVSNLNIIAIPIEAADRITGYLRSKGYAVDWMGLSVEEMVEAGWIKLIES